MRRLTVVLGFLVVGCKIWGDSVPTQFGGWFHLQHGERTVNLRFGSPDVLELRDLGCDQSYSVTQTWTEDGDAMVANQSPGAPHFTPDPNTPEALLATPGMLGTAPETWLPGASCPVCPPGDAGPSACEAPQVLDGGV